MIDADWHTTADPSPGVCVEIFDTEYGGIVNGTRIYDHLMFPDGAWKTCDGVYVTSGKIEWRVAPPEKCDCPMPKPVS